MSIEIHLILQELILPPSGEWRPEDRCWTVARVAAGLGYCLPGGTARELKTGDAVVVASKAGAILRASQLGELKLEFFLVIPQLLNGLITVVEWHQLEHAANPAMPRVFYHAANEPLAQKFTRLAALSKRDSINARSALLQLWASCAAAMLPAFGETVAGKNRLRERFRQFAGKISERELAASSLADLAAQLNCSERHFSRLFREEFGVSLRACQTELGLVRACQLLADPSVKISRVAAEGGYRHRGFFTAQFKKRFGVTPQEWRQQKPPDEMVPPARAGKLAVAQNQNLPAENPPSKPNPKANL